MTLPPCLRPQSKPKKFAMLSRQSPRSILALLFFLSMAGVIWELTGCSGMAPSTWFAEPTPEPTATATPTPTATATPTATPTPVKRRHSGKRGKGKKGLLSSPTPTASADWSGSPTPQASPTSALKLTPAVTVQEKAAQRHRGYQLIDEASAKIDGINRAKLKGHDVDDYDRVRNFIQDALEHMKQEDYMAAESLAQKASLLADQLMSRSSTPTP